MKALGPVVLLLSLLVAGCGADEDCCAPDPTPSAAPTTPSPAAAAQAFLAYAEGGPPDVPWAASVRFTVRGDLVAELEPDAADRRRSWRGCPAGEPTYEGRDCPVPPLATVADLAAEGIASVVEEEAPRIIGCNRYRPPGATGTTTLFVRPTEADRSCFTDYAIAIGLDPDGAIDAVDLALSGP